MSFFKKNYLPLALVLLATVLLAHNLDKPFVGHHDWNGAFWGSVVDKYLDFFLHGNRSEIFRANLFFAHYTPFLPILFTISSVLFGSSEFSLRLVSVFFSVLMVVFVYKIGEKLFGKMVGLVATLFLMATPMFLYFGKLPDHEPIVVSLITATFYFYLLGEAKEKRYFILFLCFLFLSLLESWPAYFLILPLIFISLFVRREGLAKAILPLGIGVVVLILHLGSIFAAQGSSGLMGFFQSGIGRSSTNDLFFGATKYSPLTFLMTEARYAVIHFTRILIVFSALYIMNVIYKTLTKKLERREIYLIALFVYPILFIFAFRELAFIHDYKLYHFLPFISLSSAVLFCYAIGKLKKFLEDAGLRIVVIKLSLAFIIFSTCALVYLERLPYLKTLQATSFNTPGYELGKLIKNTTDSGDYVLVNSGEFKEFYEVFVGYYSKRKIDYGDLSVEDYKNEKELFGKYKYVIFVKGRAYDKELFDILEKNHPSTNYRDYTFFAE